MKKKQRFVRRSEHMRVRESRERGGYVKPKLKLKSHRLITKVGSRSTQKRALVPLKSKAIKERFDFKDEHVKSDSSELSISGSTSQILSTTRSQIRTPHWAWLEVADSQTFGSLRKDLNKRVKIETEIPIRRSLRRKAKEKMEQKQRNSLLLVDEIVEISSEDENDSVLRKKQQERKCKTDSKRADMLEEDLEKLSVGSKKVDEYKRVASEYVKRTGGERQNRFCEFDNAENSVLQWIHRGGGGSKAVITQVKECGIILKREDMHRLRGTQWLNDEVSNSFICLLNSRNQVHIHNTYVFNTFFYTRLNVGKLKYDYDGVKRWTTRAKVDVTKLDYILIPVNHNNFHWVLSGISMKEKCIFYIDSMGHSKNSSEKGAAYDVMTKLKRWLSDEIVDKYGTHKKDEMEIEEWTFKVIKNIPKQTDGGSCGVFMLMFAECIEFFGKHNNFDFNAKHIPILRRRMALELLAQSLATFTQERNVVTP